MPEHEFAGQWNHDTHYYPLVADQLTGRDPVLDVGCGNGLLARYLAVREPGRSVLGIDDDPRVLPPDSPGVHCLLASAENLPFAINSFDAVVSVAALHQMDAELALTEMRRVLRPRGRIVVLDAAKGRDGSLLRTAGLELRDMVVHQVQSRGKTRWQAPTSHLPVTMNWTQTHEVVERILPGARWQRLPMWRYCVIWDAP